MNLGLGKQVEGRLSTWSHCLFWKTVEKISTFLDGSYVTEPSSVRIAGKEEFTPKSKVLRVDYHLCCIIDRLSMTSVYYLFLSQKRRIYPPEDILGFSSSFFVSNLCREGYRMKGDIFVIVTVKYIVFGDFRIYHN